MEGTVKVKKHFTVIEVYTESKKVEKEQFTIIEVYSGSKQGLKGTIYSYFAS